MVEPGTEFVLQAGDTEACPPRSRSMSNELDLTSNDAMHWAEQLEKHLKAGVAPDADYLVGWFANYWAAVHDPLKRRIEELEAALQPSLPQDVEEWIADRPTYDDGSHYISERDLRAFLAGKVLVEVEFLEVMRELVSAMRKYEMDVDEPAPFKHRNMVRRAEAMLTASKGE